jgi:hypothetical protein
MIALWMMYATIVTGLLGGAASVLERASAGQVRQRRWIWVLALSLAVAVTAWTFVAPGAATVPAAPGAAGRDRPPALSSDAPGGVAARMAALIESAESASLGRLDSPLAIAWAVAASLAFLSYGAASWALARRRRSWRPAIVDGQPVLLASSIGPAVVGTLHPQIVVPDWSLTLPDEQRALMLEHERQHIRARDPLVLHSAAMIALLMPWNAAAWWLNRRLRLAVELDCDARVLAGGRDPRAYGTLLLDVCSRRARPGALLAPALLERTSSLAKRILAMQPVRGRYPRARVALGAAVACAAIALACEMPTPEMVAPDGKDVATTRLYGQMSTTPDQQAAEPRQLIARYFPAVARGEGGPTILFLVKAFTGEVVLTETQAAAFARTPVPQRGSKPVRVLLKGSARELAEGMPRTSRAEAPIDSIGRGARRQAEASPGAGLIKVRRGGSDLRLPSGVAALMPDEIQAIDVSKHSAGSVAPSAVTIITISLKPGVTVPPSSRAP